MGRYVVVGCAGPTSDEPNKLESVSFENESVWMGNLNNTIRHINERSMAPESAEESSEEESGEEESSEEESGEKEV
ncbi:hypothetical protein LguiA_024567 [Lonicera macranthoides]